MLTSFEKAMSFTKTIHHKSYPAISPSNPANSQEGRTVIITGGSAGIGLAISRSFAAAGAAKLIILGRRADVLATAVTDIKAQVAGLIGEVEERECDISDLAQIKKLWADLGRENVVVDVLVLNAVLVPPAGPVVDVGVNPIWKSYEMNVKAMLDMTKRFLDQRKTSSSG